MAGLILVSVLGLLAVVVFKLAQGLTKSIKHPVLQILSMVVILVAFPLLMVADELIGKYQFEALCKANGIESAYVSRARGQSVRLESGKEILLDGFIMPIREYPRLFKDPTTGVTLFEYKGYRAEGGWLMRYTPINMGYSQAMLFDGSCEQVAALKSLLATNSITLLN